MNLPIIIDQKMTDRLYMMQTVIADGNFLSRSDERYIRKLRELFHTSIGEVSPNKRYQLPKQTCEELVLISFIFSCAHPIRPVWRNGGKINNYTNKVNYLLELISCTYIEGNDSPDGSEIGTYISVDKSLLLEQVIKFINNPKNYTNGYKTGI